MEPQRIKVKKNFFLDEFVDPHTYLTRSDHGMGVIDQQLFEIAQKFRDIYGKSVIINNWWRMYFELAKMNEKPSKIIKAIEGTDNVFKWSGSRPKHCPIGSPRSAHKTYQAIDPKVPGEEGYHIIKENAQLFYGLGLRRMEDRTLTRTWTHLDTLERNTQPNSIRVVDLKQATEIIRF